MTTNSERSADVDDYQRNTRRTVKARFDSDTFQQINEIRRARGVEWSTVVLYGIAEIEQEIPPLAERYSLSSGEDK